MAQAGYTPIQLYYSTTTTNVPTSGNLASGELAINITDGKLFYKDNGGSVQVIAWKTTPTTAGGTGLTSWTAGDLPYYATGTTLSKLGIGTAGQVLTSTGTAPQWSTLSGVAVTTFSAGTTGFTPSSATSGAVTLAGTLATTNGGTGLTSFTANGVFYASSTSAIGQSANLIFDGTNFVLGSAGAIRTSNASGYFETQLSYYLNAGGGGGFQLKGLGSGVAGIKFMDAADSTELMRLNSTGLGIGTSSPASKLDVAGAARLTADGASVSLYTGAGWRHTGSSGLYIDANSGGAANSVFIRNGSGFATQLTLDGSGNLGLGVTPSAWGSGWRALQIGALSNFVNNGSGNTTDVWHNGYVDTGGNVRYLTTAAASFYRLEGNTFKWFNAPSGTAGNAISFTQAMTLNASGNLGIGTTSPAARFEISGTTSFNPQQYITNTDVVVGGKISGVYFYSRAASNGWYSGIDAYVPSGAPGVDRTDLRFYTTLVTPAERMRIDPAGNLGLGVTPSAWSTGKAFEVGAAGTAIWSNSSVDSYYTQGAFFNAGWKYSHTGATGVSTYQQSQGAHKWSTAAGGTAGNAISFTQAMTLTAQGNELFVGTTSGFNSTANRGNISVNGSSESIIALGSGGTRRGYLYAYSTQMNVGSDGILGFETGGTERARITSGGEFLVGTTSPAGSSQITAYGATNGQIAVQNSTNWSRILQNGNDLYFDNGTGGTGGNIIFRNGSSTTERARITSVGNLSLGGSADRGTTVGTNAIQIFNGTAPAGTLTNGVSLYSQSGDLRFMDAAGNAYQVGFRNVPQSGAAKTGSYTLATTDVGEFIQISTGGSITIPTSTFAAGDVVSLFNNTSGNITITCSAPTAYIAGANTVVTSVTLATRGVATVLFITATLCVITGNVS